MLDFEIAQKLIDRFAEATSYNINVMDEDGTIIASGDPKRVGTFHEAAHAMIANRIPVQEIVDHGDLIGTLPGVNLILENKGLPVGVVGVTGEPELVREVAHLLKISIESQYELELQRKTALERTTRKDRFFERILYETDADCAALRELAEQLGYNPDALRIPVLILVNDASKRDEVASFCKNNGIHTKQDMLMRTADHQILVYLQLRDKRSANSQYRSVVESYLYPLQQYAEKHQLQIRYLAGTMQNRLTMYHAAFRHCQWMVHNTQKQWEVVYFYDYVNAYIQSKLQFSLSREIFDAYIEQQPEKFWKSYLPVVSTMARFNNNMVKSSQELHVHRNTLVYQYNNIRNTLQIDPVSNAADNLFAISLCQYLQSSR